MNWICNSWSRTLTALSIQIMLGRVSVYFICPKPTPGNLGKSLSWVAQKADNTFPLVSKHSGQCIKGKFPQERGKLSYNRDIQDSKIRGCFSLSGSFIFLVTRNLYPTSSNGLNLGLPQATCLTWPLFNGHHLAIGQLLSGGLSLLDLVPLPLHTRRPQKVTTFSWSLVSV